MNLKKILPILTILLTTTVTAGTTGKIAGRVVDESGNPLVGATVLIQDTAIGGMTDSNGEFFFINLEPGAYSIQARMVGMSEQIKEGVTVFTDLTTRLDFMLVQEVTGVTVITVTDQRSMILRDVTSSIHVISREDISTKPVAGIQDIVTSQPGVVSQLDGLHFRGGRAGEVVYMIDGFSLISPVSNIYNFTLPLSGISEASMITGGIGAEYGNAQSGIVNIVTREGGSQYSGELYTRTGGLSEIGDESISLNDMDLWQNNTYIGDVLNIECAVGGPEPITSLILPAAGIRIPGEIRVFATAEWIESGHDKLDSRGNWNNNWQDRWGGSLKLTYRVSPSTKITLSGLYMNRTRGWNDWQWSRFEDPYVDDGDTLYYASDVKYALPTRYEKNYSISAFITQTLNESTFIEFKLNQYRVDTEYRINVEEGGFLGEGFSLEDWNEFHPIERFLDNDGFYHSGYHSQVWYDSKSTVSTMKLELSSQLSSHHLVKTGIEARYTDVHDFSVYAFQYNDVRVNLIEAYPNSGAFYIQDKIEYTAGLIANIGIRLDYFNANRNQNVINEEEEIVVMDVPVKYNISPRLGVSHPVTENDVIYFSYGQYYQIPNMNVLYYGSDYNLSGEMSLVGNPDLDLELTTSYEVGLRHQFDEITLLGLTAYYKDMENLITTEAGTSITDYYYIYVNSSGSGSARGIELSLTKRPSNFWSTSFNYTYSIAKGRNSSPTENYSYGWAGFEAPDNDVYLDWDQRHTINANLDFRIPRGEGPRLIDHPFLEGSGLNITWQFGSGCPYDNPGHGTHAFFRNQRRYPVNMNTNLRVNKKFWIDDMLTLDLFCSIYNLFNERNIYAIMSAAWYDADMDGDGEPDHDPTGYFDDPGAWSPARHILFGLLLTW